MRWPILLVIFLTCYRVELPTPEPKLVVVAPTVDFTKDILPIVQRCQPCHFPGGTMYARLPFDRAETIEELGTKLFTRIKAEEDQVKIRAFLAERSR